jgi:hypothetical protein
MREVASRLSAACAAVLAGAAVAAVTMPGVAGASTAARTPAPLGLGYGDFIYNYDLTERSISATNADWPISFIVYNGASVNDLKNTMEQFNYKQGSIGAKYALLSDGETTGHVHEWDQDNGKKMLSCPSFGEQSPHYRVYADQNDYLDSMSRGPYIMVSTHRDYQECGGGAKFYDSEKVEGGIVTNLGTLYQVWHDWYSWGNAEPLRVDGNHTWDSDGRGSYVNRCPSCTSSVSHPS